MAKARQQHQQQIRPRIIAMMQHARSNAKTKGWQQHQQRSVAKRGHPQAARHPVLPLDRQVQAVIEQAGITRVHLFAAADICGPLASRQLAVQDVMGRQLSGRYRQRGQHADDQQPAAARR